jgi:hypothetical protein
MPVVVRATDGCCLLANRGRSALFFCRLRVGPQAALGPNALGSDDRRYESAGNVPVPSTAFDGTMARFIRGPLGRSGAADRPMLVHTQFLAVESP